MISVCPLSVAAMPAGSAASSAAARAAARVRVNRRAQTVERVRYGAGMERADSVGRVRGRQGGVGRAVVWQGALALSTYRVGGFARRAVLIRLRFAAFRQESRGVATHGKWHNRNRYNGLRSAHAVATPEALAT